MLRKLGWVKNLSATVLSLGIGLRSALAQTPCPAGQICDPLGGATFTELIEGFIYKFAIPVSALICSIMVLYGAFLMITSLGELDKYQKGKDVIKWAIVGFAIVALSGGVASIIQELLSASAA